MWSMTIIMTSPNHVIHGQVAFKCLIENFSLDWLDFALRKGGFELVLFQWIIAFQMHITHHVASMHDEGLNLCVCDWKFWLHQAGWRATYLGLAMPIFLVTLALTVSFFQSNLLKSSNIIINSSEIRILSNLIASIELSLFIFFFV